VVADYTLDEARSVLIERRGDGATVEIPVEARAVAGTFRAAPDRRGTLVGWAADLEAHRPVDLIVVLRGNRLVTVVPTAFVRPGVAEAHGVDPGARIGFVADGLDDTVVADARVFAVRSGSAVELVRGAG
jgi:hypothetical protein